MRISMYETAMSGTSEEMSVKVRPPLVSAPDMTVRRLFKSTSVDETPRPRRLKLEVPVVPFWVKASGLFWAPLLMVSVWTKSAKFAAPIASRCSPPITAIGFGLSAWDFLRI